jgi:hypothetical protein
MQPNMQGPPAQDEVRGGPDKKDQLGGVIKRENEAPASSRQVAPSLPTPSPACGGVSLDELQSWIDEIEAEAEDE